jgi:hypothetical protein
MFGNFSCLGSVFHRLILGFEADLIRDWSLETFHNFGSAHLFSNRRPPLEQFFKVTFAQNLEIFTIGNNILRGSFQL